MRIYTEKTAADTPADLHAAAYALLFGALRRDWGVPSPELLKTARGKPYLAGENAPHISVSHTRGFVCCAVSNVPCGVDCECLRPLPAVVLPRVCTQREIDDILSSADPSARFLLYWALKEAMSKKIGDGLAGGFKRFEIRFSGGEPLCPGHRLCVERHGAFFVAGAE